jgi:hypothetical protein
VRRGRSAERSDFTAAPIHVEKLVDAATSRGPAVATGAAAGCVVAGDQCVVASAAGEAIITVAKTKNLRIADATESILFKSFPIQAD